MEGHVLGAGVHHGYGGIGRGSLLHEHGGNGLAHDVGAAQDDGLIAACRDYYTAIEPHLGGYYSNIDFDHTAARGNYGPAYDRLAGIKREVAYFRRKRDEFLKS